jgi:hypothetical protein
MIKAKLLQVVLLISMAISACSAIAPNPSSPPPLPSPSKNWRIKLTQSGGFAGVLLSVEVSSDGRLTAENQRTGQTVTQTVSSQTTAELGRLIGGIAPSGGDKPGSACADCFIYDLELHRDSGDMQIHVDDTSIDDFGAADLIRRLSQLRDDALRTP